MTELIIHPLTQQQLDAFVSAPSHALLLSGPTGIGKQSVAYQLTSVLMEIPEEKVTEHQYIRIIGAGKEKSISIDKVRELEQFLSRKVPGDGRRVVIVDDAHLLGVEAQNALLKTLEEPPQNTVLILTVAHEQALLPTILSRLQKQAILRPSGETIKAAIQAKGYQRVAIDRAYAMSGGLPGLMTAILEGQDEHPLVQAAGIARQIAQSSTFDRLAMVDGLSKDREQCLQVLTVLQQMARVSMRSGNVAESWQKVLKRCHEAIGELLANGQPKLVLTNLMLAL
jgi:DNA polymerase-3 subunit delta'